MSSPGHEEVSDLLKEYACRSGKLSEMLFGGLGDLVSTAIPFVLIEVSMFSSVRDMSALNRILLN
jgi:hypothetical protein